MEDHICLEDGIYQFVSFGMNALKLCLKFPSFFGMSVYLSILCRSRHLGVNNSWAAAGSSEMIYMINTFATEAHSVKQKNSLLLG